MNSLKNRLKMAKVASCAYQETQLRNFCKNSATSTATTAQQIDASPSKTRVFPATGNATTPQLSSCAGGQKTPPKSCASCAPVAQGCGAVLPTELHAEKLASLLLTREMERDDRHACLECVSLIGAMGVWRCAAFRQRGAHGPDLPADYVQMLTRCQTFTAGEPQTYTIARPTNEPRLLKSGRAPGPWLSASETAAAQKYHHHHASCPQCQAAGRGYGDHCGAGMALWNQYQGGDHE